MSQKSVWEKEELQGWAKSGSSFFSWPGSLLPLNCCKRIALSNWTHDLSFPHDPPSPPLYQKSRHPTSTERHLSRTKRAESPPGCTNMKSHRWTVSVEEIYWKSLDGFRNKEPFLHLICLEYYWCMQRYSHCNVVTSSAAERQTVINASTKKK